MAAAKPVAVVASTVRLLLLLLPLAVASTALVFRLRLEAVTLAATIATPTAVILPALAVTVEPVLRWLLPKPAFKPGALVATKLLALLAALAIAVDAMALLLTLTWLPVTAKLAAAAPVWSLNLADTVLPLLFDIRVKLSLACTLSTDAARPELATAAAAGFKSTKPVPLALPLTVSVLALRLSCDAAALPSAVAEMLLSLRLTEPVMMVGVGSTIPTVTCWVESITLAKELTVLLAWVLSTALLAWMLPTLAEVPALIRLPAKLAVAVADWTLLFWARLPAAKLSALVLMLLVSTELVKTLPALR